jgi:hypothetical protein
MDSSASSSSANGTTSATGVSPASLRGLQVGETCSRLRPDFITGCRASRSCRSCLQVSGCMVGTRGTCVSQQEETLDPSLRFDRAFANGLVLPNATARAAQTRETQVWQFPAGSIQYCSQSDAVCRACRRAAFWRSSDLPPDSRFCLGEDGACVCIDVCERQLPGRSDCSRMGMGGLSTPLPTPAAAPAPSVSEISGSSNGQWVWHTGIGAMIFALVAVGFLLHARCSAEKSYDARQDAQRRREQASRERREARAAARGVNPLTLTGWGAYHRALIDKEVEALQGADGSKTKGEQPMSPVAVTTANHTECGNVEDDEDQRHRENGAVYVRMDEGHAHGNATETPARSLLAPLSTSRQHPHM